jgi:hypothetical protein
MAKRFTHDAVHPYMEPEEIDDFERGISKVVARAIRNGTLGPGSPHHPDRKLIVIPATPAAQPQSEKEIPTMTKPNPKPTTEKHAAYYAAARELVAAGTCQATEDVHRAALAQAGDGPKDSGSLRWWARKNGVALPRIDRAEQYRRAGVASVAAVVAQAAQGAPQADEQAAGPVAAAPAASDATDAPRDAFETAQENRRLRIELDRMQKSCDNGVFVVGRLQGERDAALAEVATLRHQLDQAETANGMEVERLREELAGARSQIHTHILHGDGPFFVVDGNLSELDGGIDRFSQITRPFTSQADARQSIIDEVAALVKDNPDSLEGAKAADCSRPYLILAQVGRVRPVPRVTVSVEIEEV